MNNTKNPVLQLTAKCLSFIKYHLTFQYEQIYTLKVSTTIHILTKHKIQHLSPGFFLRLRQGWILRNHYGLTSLMLAR